MTSSLKTALYDARLLKVITALFVLALIWLWMSFLLWQLPSVDGPNPPSSAASLQPAAINPTGSFDLFGRTQKSQRADSAPVSQLELRLTGTMAADNPAKGLAFIDNKSGQQKAFRVGDTVFEMAELTAIYPDYVLLRHNGREEKIALSQPIGFAPEKSRRPASQRTAVPGIRGQTVARSNRAQQARQDEIRQKYLIDPQAIAKNIQVVPIADGSGLSGLRVSALRQGNILLKAGLKSNDLITAINGKAISPTNLMALTRELESASRVSLSIRRNGRPQTVQVDLNSLKQ